MKVRLYQCLGLLIACAAATSPATADLKTVFSDGTVNGKLRTYYNIREFEAGQPELSAFAAGVTLRGETAAAGDSARFQLGAGYYSANDMGLNSNDPTQVLGTLGDELEVLAEVYAKFNILGTRFTGGRQLLSTPFANGGDAFMVPFAFEGLDFTNTSVDDLKISLSHIDEIKNRNSDTFVNVGAFATGRYGLTPTDTDGTTILGVTYAPSALKFQTWYYQFIDLFDTVYLQGDYTFGDGNIKPFIGVQFGSQSDSGDALLGTVDSSLTGAQGGIMVGKAKFTLAMVSVAEETGAFNNGAFLAPYNFSTSTLFTNNQLQTMENVDAGDSNKFTFNYTFGENTKFKASYATFDFETAADREETDLDVTYKFTGGLDGLSFRYRVALVTSDVPAVEVTNHRFMLQFAF